MITTIKKDNFGRDINSYASGHKLVSTYKGLGWKFPFGQIVVLFIYFSEASGASRC